MGFLLELDPKPTSIACVKFQESRNFSVDNPSDKYGITFIFTFFLIFVFDSEVTTKRSSSESIIQPYSDPTAMSSMAGVPVTATKEERMRQHLRAERKRLHAISERTRFVIACPPQSYPKSYPVVLNRTREVAAKIRELRQMMLEHGVRVRSLCPLALILTYCGPWSVRKPKRALHLVPREQGDYSHHGSGVFKDFSWYGGQKASQEQLAEDGVPATARCCVFLWEECMCYQAFARDDNVYVFPRTHPQRCG